MTSKKYDSGPEPLKVLRSISEIKSGSKILRFVEVRNYQGKIYSGVRIYNEKNHFIKQMLFNRESLKWLDEVINLYLITSGPEVSEVKNG